jgi:hypothetical protein
MRLTVSGRLLTASIRLKGISGKRSTLILSALLKLAAIAASGIGIVCRLEGSEHGLMPVPVVVLRRLSPVEVRNAA